MGKGRTFIRECAYICGDYIDGAVYPVFQTKGKRRQRCKPTKAIQARLNEQNAKKRLTRLIHMNFTPDDLAMHVTYRPGEEPETPEAAYKDIRNFIRRLKRRYDRAGLCLKYIYTTEYGRKTGRVHHHLILSGGMNRDELETLWGKGYANSKRLQFGEDGVTGLAHYIAKDQSFYRRWSGSRNLCQPEAAIFDGRITATDAQALAEAADGGMAWRILEAQYPGFVLTNAYAIRNAVNRGEYIHFEMRRDQGRKITRARRNIFQERHWPQRSQYA